MRRGTPEHNTWRAIVQRCTNPNNKSFARYGGKGVGICERWRASFDAFLADVGPQPAPGFTLDRVDNTKGYEPGNVRWATQTEQQRNRTNNKYLTVGGETLSVDDWAKRLDMSPHTLWTRISRGWSDEDVVSPPLRKPSQGWRRSERPQDPIEKKGGA